MDVGTWRVPAIVGMSYLVVQIACCAGTVPGVRDEDAGLGRDMRELPLDVAEVATDSGAEVCRDVPAVMDASVSEDAAREADADGDSADAPDISGGADGAPGVDADALPACVCAAGPCCDGCRFLSLDTVCDVGEEHGCPWGTDCGSAVGVRELQRTCSGASAGCGDGPTEIGEWRVASACSAESSCVEGQSACVPSAACPCPGGMAHVPAGSFPMGSLPGQGHPNNNAEYPQHEVHVQPYCIGRYEVTAGEYVEFLNDAAPDDRCRLDSAPLEPCACIDWNFYAPEVVGLSPRPPVEWTGPPSGAWTVGTSCQPTPYAPPLSDCSSHPITFVTWCGARRYCEWAGKRLPSEAEWERACKGTTDRQYVWGDEAVSEGRANCGEDLCADGFEYYDAEYRSTYVYPSPVGTFPFDRSPAGAYDMAGNVSEWVEDDFFWDYEGAPVDGSAWTADVAGEPGHGKLVRGGAIDTASRWGMRCAGRVGGGDSFGFRCAWSPAPPP